MNRSVQLLSCFILLVIALFVGLAGVGAGAVVAAAVFVVKYSRTNPVRHVIGAAGRSRIDRSAQYQEILESSPESIVAFGLQRYLFFGSIITVRRQVDMPLNEDKTSFIVIDFARVTGIDSTAAGGLHAITAALADRDIATVWSGLRPHIAAELHADSVQVAHVAIDLGHAIVWSQDLFLAASEVDGDINAPDVQPFSASITEALDLPLIRLEAGSTLMSIGDADQDMCFVESGTLTA